MYGFSKVGRYSVDSVHITKVPLLNNNNQQPIDKEASSDVMKLQELDIIHVN